MEKDTAIQDLQAAIKNALKSGVRQEDIMEMTRNAVYELFQEELGQVEVEDPADLLWNPDNHIDLYSDDDFDDDDLYDEPDYDEPEPVDLGSCCECGLKGPTVQNVLMLPFRSPKPRTGWGCFACDLPNDGFMAVLCNDCMDLIRKEDRFPKNAALGYLGEDVRVPIEEVRQYPPHEHDMKKH